MINFDLLSKHEELQLRAHSLGDISQGQIEAAHKRRKETMKNRTIIELGVTEDELNS